MISVVPKPGMHVHHLDSLSLQTFGFSESGVEPEGLALLTIDANTANPGHP